MELAEIYPLIAGLVSLTALEIVLGIDNVVFIALAVAHLNRDDQKKARFLGLGLALLFRVLMLLGIVWLVSMKEPWFHFYGFEISAKDLMMLFGGLFLIYKATISIHEEIGGEKKKEFKALTGSFKSTVIQIVAIDIIFSFDSVMTAVGLTENLYIIVIAICIAMLVMLFSSGLIVDFISANPTVKMLALSFVLMIGVLLVGEGCGFSIPKGYIYFGMAFSLGVEMLNMTVKRRKKL